MSASRLQVAQEDLARVESDEFANAFARIENHYFVNEGFIRQGQLLLLTINKIRRIPGGFVQGRYDVVCPAASAWALHRAWPEAELHIVPDAGHGDLTPCAVGSNLPRPKAIYEPFGFEVTDIIRSGVGTVGVERFPVSKCSGKATANGNVDDAARCDAKC